MRITIIRDHFPPIPIVDPYEARISENHTVDTNVITLTALDNDLIVSGNKVDK